MAKRLDDLIREHPELEKARETLAQWESEHDSHTDECRQLHAQIQELEETVKKLELDIARMEAEEAGFLSAHDVLWKLGADGTAEPAVYCPTCKLVMTPLPSGFPEYFVCTKCHFRADLDPEKIVDLAADVSGGP
jgi:hypothetical protein